jgi:L-ascorbate metabolism protein UlaG (beta-lactamase superfamily)
MDRLTRKLPYESSRSKNWFSSSCVDAEIFNLPVICQPQDEQKLMEFGFLQTIPVTDGVEWEGIRLFRTGGQHGTGEIGERMGPVSGFVIQADEEPSLYVAGDTIYCKEVEQALETYNPHIAVVNAGAAQFAAGDPITMTGQDVAAVCRKAPDTCLVAVHMETINHCLLTRNELHRYLEECGLAHRVQIPMDGDILDF